MNMILYTREVYPASTRMTLSFLKLIFIAIFSRVKRFNVKLKGEYIIISISSYLGSCFYYKL